MKAVVVLVLALAIAAATAPAGGAANECHGIQKCVPVSGPWVVVHPGAETDYLLSCAGQGVVGGLDAVATTTAVRVGFAGRIGAPVQPGVTTTTSAFFQGQLVDAAVGAFQPWVGCIPASGGGGRSTVSARVAPGPSIDRIARIVVITPGTVKTAAIGCPTGEKLVGGWSTVAFRTKKAPNLRAAREVQATHAVARGKVHVTVAATDALPIDAHAVVQVGAECAP